MRQKVGGLTFGGSLAEYSLDWLRIRCFAKCEEPLCCLNALVDLLSVTSDIWANLVFLVILL